MISHLTLGSNDIKRAERFYQQLLGEIGGSQIYQSDSVIFFSFPNSDTKLAISTPYDGQPATVGNGTMLALKLNDSNQVDTLYNLAVEMGAKNEGEPGPRNEGAFYGAYVRDLDGNKIALFYRE